MDNLIKRSTLVALILCILVSAASAQVKLRTIKEPPLHKDSPIVVVSRELGSKAFSKRNQVLGDQDWLKHLTLGVKNASNKNIVYFEINLLIPRQRQLPANISVAIFFGNGMAPAIATPEDPVLPPGDIVKVSVSENEITRWDKVLKKYDVEDFDYVTLDIRTVHFDDGTGWQLGIPLQQDPNQPRTWRSLLTASKSIGSSSLWIAMLAPAPLLSLFGGFARFSFSPTRWNCSPPPRVHAHSAVSA